MFYLHANVKIGNGAQSRCNYTVEYMLQELWHFRSYSSLYLFQWLKLFRKSLLLHKHINSKALSLLATHNFVVFMCVLPNCTRALTISIHTITLKSFFHSGFAKKSRVYKYDTVLLRYIYFILRYTMSQITLKNSLHILQSTQQCIGQLHVCKTKLVMIYVQFNNAKRCKSLMRDS